MAVNTIRPNGGGGVNRVWKYIPDTNIHLGVNECSSLQKQAKNFITSKALKTKQNEWTTKGINYWKTESQKSNFILEKPLAAWSSRVFSLSEVLNWAVSQWFDVLDTIDFNINIKHGKELSCSS